MNQAQLTYLIKCVVPSVITVRLIGTGVDEHVKVEYMGTHGVNTIHCSLSEYQRAVSRVDSQMYARHLANCLMDEVIEQSIMAQYDPV